MSSREHGQHALPAGEGGGGGVDGGGGGHNSRGGGVGGNEETVVENSTEDFDIPQSHQADTREKWLHRKMARASSEKLLESRGSFLIRESHNPNQQQPPLSTHTNVQSSPSRSVPPSVPPSEGAPHSSHNHQRSLHVNGDSEGGGGLSGAGAASAACPSSSSASADSNSYVLSYKSQSDEFCHFKILQSCGQVFIGGKRFQSLEHLVYFYSVKECIVPTEYLLHPIAPKLPSMPQKRRMIAKYNYKKVPETDELSLQLGEILTVENDDSGSGWFWLKSEATRESGWVHDLLVSPYVACLEELKSKEYFAICDKDDCTRYLKSGAPGCFLVREGTRPSTSDPITLTLCVRTPENIQRFKIEVRNEMVPVSSPSSSETTENPVGDEDGCMDESFDSSCSRLVDVYFMGGRRFTSVDQLISRYQSEEILDNLRLNNPPEQYLEWRATTLRRQDEEKFKAKIGSGKGGGGGGGGGVNSHNRNGHHHPPSMLINGQRSSQEDSFDAEDDMQNAVLRSRMSTSLNSTWNGERRR
ncbi:uncharacterized protein LOC142343249 isoform X2 [Convolutriloba macropyga]|uniref:uncharacterized protein LOC142343249 isoform X2 n=1 Tax=Convolutriloba macropyga TaxID=536237 RepID=UPI003F5278B6